MLLIFFAMIVGVSAEESTGISSNVVEFDLQSFSGDLINEIGNIFNNVDKEIL